MADKPRNILIKHPNNPVTPKQRAYYARLTGVSMPTEIKTVMGASLAIGLAIANRKFFTDTGTSQFLLGWECFATFFDQNGIADITSCPSGYDNGLWVYANNNNREKSNMAVKSKPKVKPVIQNAQDFDSILVIHRNNTME